MGKQNKLAEAKEWAKNVVDSLEKPIDKGILDLVIVLHAFGITTTMSCEGHVSWGTGGPYVDVEDPKAATIMQEFIRYKKLPTKADKALNERNKLNMKYASVLVKLLDQFYKTHSAAIEDRIILKLQQDIRIQNQGAEINAFRSRVERQWHLKRYQKEFNVFTKFLYTLAS